MHILLRVTRDQILFCTYFITIGCIKLILFTINSNLKLEYSMFQCLILKNINLDSTKLFPAKDVLKCLN